MAKYASKNIQTKPELAGESNMPPEMIKRASREKCDDDLMANLSILFDKGVKTHNKKSKWTADLLYAEIKNYFEFCVEKRLKPNKAGLRTWLGMSRSQYHAWESEPQRFKEITDIICLANGIMEEEYINRVESFPTGNIFLLKSMHGLIDRSAIDVTTNNTNSEEVKDLVNKLGLDKTE